MFPRKISTFHSLENRYSSVKLRFGLHDPKKEISRILIPNPNLENEITKSRDHLCSYNQEK